MIEIKSDLLNGSYIEINRMRNRYHNEIFSLKAKVSDDIVIFSVLVYGHKFAANFDGGPLRYCSEFFVLGECNVTGAIETTNCLYDFEGDYSLKLSLNEKRDNIEIQVKQNFSTWARLSRGCKKEVYQKLPFTSVNRPFSNRFSDFFQAPQQHEISNKIKVTKYFSPVQYELLIKIQSPLENTEHCEHVKNILCFDNLPTSIFVGSRSFDLDFQSQIENSVCEYRLLKKRIEWLNYLHYRGIVNDTFNSIVVVIGQIIGWEQNGIKIKLIQQMSLFNELGKTNVIHTLGLSLEEADTILNEYDKYYNWLEKIRLFFGLNALAYL